MLEKSILFIEAVADANGEVRSWKSFSLTRMFAIDLALTSDWKKPRVSS